MPERLQLLIEISKAITECNTAMYMVHQTQESIRIISQYDSPRAVSQRNFLQQWIDKRDESLAKLDSILQQYFTELITTILDRRLNNV